MTVPVSIVRGVRIGSECMWIWGFEEMAVDAGENFC